MIRGDKRFHQGQEKDYVPN